MSLFTYTLLAMQHRFSELARAQRCEQSRAKLKRVCMKVMSMGRIIGKENGRRPNLLFSLSSSIVTRPRCSKLVSISSFDCCKAQDTIQATLLSPRSDHATLHYPTRSDRAVRPKLRHFQRRNGELTKQ